MVYVEVQLRGKMEVDREDCMAWVFDNVGKTALDDIEAQIKKAGGNIVETMRKLDHGGAVVKLKDDTSAATMSAISDWCAKLKIRMHPPKMLQRGQPEF